MHLPEKQKPIDFCKGALSKMMIDIIENGGLHPQQSAPQEQVMLGESSGEEHEMKAPKRRAETWVHEEITSLIKFRREIDALFNTTKSNRHLWQQISSKMRDNGFDRSPSMCTDKWRNLLKEFKKVKHQGRESGWAKMLYYKEIEELLEERSKNAPYKSRKKPPKVDSYMQFSDKVCGRSSLNCERHSDHEGRFLAITTNEAVPAIGVPLWNWRETSGNGGENQSYNGRVITVKWGDFTRRIGIDGTANAIKEAIKSGFGLRTSRAFWLEDEDEIIRSLDRDMPLGIYNLRLDEGLTIKICIFDESGRIPIQTEVKTLYTENDFCEFLAHRGWTGLRDLSGFRSIDTLNDLHSGGMYQGIRRLSD